MKSDRLFIVVGVVCAAIALSSCAQRDIQNMDSKGKNIVCFGDSLTWGYGASAEENYPVLLSKMVDTPVINAGVDGDTSVEAVERLESDVLTKDPLLVIVEFGGNDFLRRIPKEQSFKNIAEIVDKIQEKGAMVAIMDISSGLFLSEYRSALSHMAREKGAIFISQTLNGIITNSSMKSDFIHPNAAGYRLIVQRVYRRIAPYLNRGPEARSSQQ